ncbi:Solute carrier family 35 member E3 [Frankliniella fusca]|uniref:Solute carrier family 35 member E3 n=1 Tax=Frankliniella fusca TaxID=407009 RepID=A0AAE1LJJ0_9NEOP|nr:Solute carrier family 35 member E3 [Frankliniella fusca]
MDGLPLTYWKLWPILGDLVGTDNDPFVIAMKYCEKLSELLETGHAFEGKVYDVRIRHYILYAPARSFIKCCIGHSGYCACEKCTDIREYHDKRVTFLDMDAPLLREQPNHHTGDSPLDDLGTNMISQFRLDPMRLTWRGAVKLGPWKLHYELVEIISSVFEFLRDFCPVDFNRKPRSLKYFKTFKFTEFRRIVLYDGILAFKDLLDDNVYKHFLLLHCALYILSSKRFFQVKRALPLQVIITFLSLILLQSMERSLLNVKTLDEFSAFKFENKSKSVKETLRSGLRPLQQLARRDEEKKSSRVIQKSKPKHKLVCEVIAGQQNKKLKVGTFTLKVGKSDSCFKSKQGDVVVLLNIVQRKRKVHFVCRKFNISENFYEYPIASSDLGILSRPILFRVSDLGREKALFQVERCGLQMFPHAYWQEPFLCVPILHSSEIM